MTTDERLAALEAKLDALTAPPSDYYTSRYSGEEIDAAIAAVPGKAETAQLCNRNLLDNWYFGNPVDQRGGHFIPKGGTHYTDAACTTVGGTMVNNYNVVPVSSTTYKYTQASGNILYFKAEDVVRGYVGAGYGLDRWTITGASSTIAITDGGITYQNTAATNGVRQYIENPSKLSGGTITVSALLGVSNGTKVRVGYSDGTLHYGEWGEDGIITLTGQISENVQTLFCFVQCNVIGKSPLIQAAKLEFGDTQTLAHQDAGGNWVLNEVPDYGEQLRRCQRYFVRLGDDRAGRNCAAGFANCANATTGNAFISTPVSMRATPAISLKNIKLRKGITDYDVTAVNPIYATKNGIYCALTSSGLPTGETLIVRTVSGGYMDASADL